MVVGPVAALVEQRGWFVERPLFGARVLVTRSAGQANSLSAALAELGAEVLLQPAIEIGPPEDWRPLDEAIAALERYDWLVFASTNGVQAFFQRLLASRDLRAARPCAAGGDRSGQCPGVGPLPSARRRRARRVSRRVARRGAARRSGRGQAISAWSAPAAAGSLLAEELSAAGGRVDQVVAYTSRDVAVADPQIARLLADGQIDWITVTSSAIARSLVHLFGERLRKAKLASISPLTSATLRELGFEVTAEATSYTMQGVCEAILSRHARSESP